MPNTSVVSSPYSNLLSPISVGGTSLKNRVIMGSMHTRLEHMDHSLERQAAFYSERARGGVALIVSGGYSPNREGLLEPNGPILDTPEMAEKLRFITDAVHSAESKILLQILHAGRYAKHDDSVGASDTPSPINKRKPRMLTDTEVDRTVDDYVRCAELAAQAGYDGVEVMGSEGYLINQFSVKRTNTRTDDWGGSSEKRRRFPVEIVRRIRQRLKSPFLIMYRLSALDLVDGGATAEEIDALARDVEAAGADILNTGIGWHEAPIPTIAYMVPRAAWRFAPARLKKAVNIPVVASNRINTPETAEEIIANGNADLVSMARPFLADAEFVRKVAENRVNEINTCIACNQACLDFVFKNRTATCLVNPRACREIELNSTPATQQKRIAVVGAGAAGLAFAITAAERGHKITLYETSTEIGGQLNLARRVPGKQEFNELIRYYRRQLERTGVTLHTNTPCSVSTILHGNFDEAVISTGVTPRKPEIPGVNHPKVLSYVDALKGQKNIGARVAIIGAGGIGFDVAMFLTAPKHPPQTEIQYFLAEWGVDPAFKRPGGLTTPHIETPPHKVSLLQRKSKFGTTLGLTTGWTLRSELARRNVEMIPNCAYDLIDDAGLHFSTNSETRLLHADTIILCTGQESERNLYDELKAARFPVTIIGGAEKAAELDALRAIDQGIRLALTL